MVQHSAHPLDPLKPGNVDELDLSVIGPGSEYEEFNLTEGDFYRVSDFGTYAVYRRTDPPWSDLSISAHVRLCGQEEVATSDRAVPRGLAISNPNMETAGVPTVAGFFTGNTERASFRLELRDGSCKNRVEGSGTECHVICRVLEQDRSTAVDLSWLSAPTWSSGTSCLYPRCDEKAWSNEYPVLGPLDELNIEGVEIYSEGGSGRRLAERWLVRVKFTVEAYNAVQNKVLLQRVGALGLPESTVSSPVDVGFVGSTPLQDGAQPPSPGGTETSSTAAARDQPTEEGTEDGPFDGLKLGRACAASCAASCASTPGFTRILETPTGRIWCRSAAEQLYLDQLEL
eukprot:Skav220569  [mRNA]  locus=scaffold145:37332:54825:- [translate_table: standard]